MWRFRVRPGYKSKHLLVEFRGDHHSEGFPNVYRLLARALGAVGVPYPSLGAASTGLTTDEILSCWRYEHGQYLVDDDVWSLFIHASHNNAQIMADIEQALLVSGLFVKEEVDFEAYK